MITSTFFAIATCMIGSQLENVENSVPYVVVYNIQDLEITIPDYTNVPEMNLNAVLSNNNQGNIFTNSPNQNKRNTNNSQEIINLIENFVEPEIWGDTATIRYWNGNLIIKAPKRIHDQIK